MAEPGLLAQDGWPAALFWALAGAVAYVYIGYPLVLAAWARVRPRRWRRAEPDPLPGVSIVIAARNEVGNLPRRLENLRQLDYPADRIEVIVVSDGSTDGTDDIVAAYGEPIRLVRLPHGGKAAALNAGVAAARHAILVFADARQWFAPDAVRQLVRNFSDPSIGGVSGELVLDTEPAALAGTAGKSSVGEGVGLYWRYEKWLRRHESLVSSTLGATGAIYALRRELWQPLPPGTLLDDVLAPMRVVLAGRRVVFDETARAYDTAEIDAAAEHRRKRRTQAGNYQILRLEPRLLLPGLNPVWIQYVSHKLGRLAVPWMLIALLALNAWLAFRSAIYALLLGAQAAFYLLAVYGAWLDARRHPAGVVPCRT